MVKHILLIEDDPLTGFLYKRALERSGYDVALAQSATDGISSAREHRPDLVLVDSWLPHTKTADVISDVVSTNTAAPVPLAVLAAKNCTLTPQDAFNVGANYYWPKHEVAPQALVEKISSTFAA